MLRQDFDAAPAGFESVAAAFDSPLAGLVSDVPVLSDAPALSLFVPESAGALSPAFPSDGVPDSAGGFPFCE